MYNQKGNEGTNYNEFCTQKKEQTNILQTKILTKYLPCLQRQYQTKKKKLNLPSSLIATSKGKK